MNRDLYKNIPLQQQLYTIAYVILVVKSFLDSSQLWRRPEILDSLLLCSYFGLIFLKLFMQDYNWKMIAGMILLGLPCVFTCFKISYFTILFTFTLIIGLQHVDYKKTLNAVSNTKLLILGIHVLVYIVVYIVAPQTLHFSYRTAGEARHYFYMGHANTFSAYLVWAMIEKLYANYERITYRHIWFVWAVYFTFYQFTDSNTSLIVTTICCVLMSIDKGKKELLRKPMTTLSQYTYGILAIFFTFMASGYTKFGGGLLVVFNFLNDFFTGRLLFGAYLYNVFGPTPLGQIVYLNGTTYWYGHWIDTLVIDNCYLMLLEYYGWFYMLVLAVAFMIIMSKKGPFGNIERIIIFAYTYFSVMENYATNAVLCFPLIFIGVYVYRNAEAKTASEVKGALIGSKVLTKGELQELLDEESKKEYEAECRNTCI